MASYINVFRTELIIFAICALALLVPDQSKEFFAVIVEDGIRSESKKLMGSKFFYTFLLITIITFVAIVSIALKIDRGRESINFSRKANRSIFATIAAFISCAPLTILGVGLFEAKSEVQSYEFSDFLLEWILIALSIAVIQILAYRHIDKMLSSDSSLDQTKLKRAFLISASFVLIASWVLTMFAVQLTDHGYVNSIIYIFLFAGCMIVILHISSFIYHRTKIPILSISLSVVLLNYIFSLNENNYVLDARKAPGSVPVVLESAQARPFSDYFNRWLAVYRARAGSNGAAGKPRPIFVVAAEGGGVYASLHAALFLSRISDACPRFSDSIFAISGVSGGAVGAAAYVAALKHLSGQGDADKPDVKKCAFASGSTGRHERLVQDFFGEDFLTPLVAATLFRDLPQKFIPRGFPNLDRSRALEASFENAWAKVAGLKRMSGAAASSHPFSETYSALYAGDPKFPALVFNATRLDNGARQLIAPFQMDNFSLLDSNLPLGWGVDMPISVAVGISARFPWVTPPAVFRVQQNSAMQQYNVELVDGGYFENSGIETALDLTKSVREELKRHGADGEFQVVLLSIKSVSQSAPGSALSSEILAPLQGLLLTRRERGVLAFWRAYQDLCPDCEFEKPKVSDNFLYHNLDFLNFSLPLGWHLSSQKAQYIVNNIGDPKICDDIQPSNSKESVAKFKNCTVHVIGQLLDRI